MKKLKVMMMTLMMCLVSMSVLTSCGKTTETPNTTENIAVEDVVEMIPSVVDHSKDSVYLINTFDPMENSYTLNPSRGFYVDGVYMMVWLDNGFLFDALYVSYPKSVGCTENGEIIIMFTDGTTLKKRTEVDFNCSAYTYFKFNKSNIDKLRHNTISKIRVTDGYGYKSFEGNLSEQDSRYFIQVMHALDKKLAIDKQK